MKRSIIIELLIFFVFVVLVALSIILWKRYNDLNYFYTYFINTGHDDIAQEYPPMIVHCLIYAILSAFALLADFAAIIMLAIKDFPVFKPLVDKLNERKQKHAQAKAERADRAKQAKIAELEQQLEELKKE